MVMDILKEMLNKNPSGGEPDGLCNSYAYTIVSRKRPWPRSQ